MKEEKLLDLLKVMLKNSRLSDRELARLMNLSQPTVSRVRTALEKQGYIKTYTVIPDFRKMGYRLLAFTFCKMKSYPNAKEAMDLVRQGAEWASKRPNVVFASDGQGLGGSDIVVMSFHKDYDEYLEFMHSYAFEWGYALSTFDSFIVSTTSKLVMKPFDLRYLANDK
jgi:DNA-binding Lrp family transcriptional regulator